ncbi:cadmium resistance transporter [Tumidithrix elongata RA019]|uniref:Cadmium resistance transporter n=1 Tax=Tumidithrix elongata BACA0141 TaxID=2716417 RepID=A0AAW9Q3Y5_9CYAN|nr:cadmium resistance transporter [Tumidithrix elongata RA019]
MSWLLTTIPAGITAFAATNLDDLVILTLLFSQVNATFRSRHIVFGQYLGFCVLLLASLPGFFGGMILPQNAIGLLGLVPIALGLKQLFTSDRDTEDEGKEEIAIARPASIFSNIFSPQACSVASITIANGSDNIGIYVPMFANSHLDNLLVTVGIFLILVGVWCFATYQLTRQPGIADLLTQYGSNFVPYVLIGLGIYIVLDSSALNPLTLAASCIGLIGLVKLADLPAFEQNRNQP